MSTAVGAYAGPARLGDARTTAGVTWDGRIITWADLPADAQAANAGGATIGEGVLAIAGARRIGGVPHQVRLAWRAWDDLIVVVTAARPLRWREDNRLAPAGSWFTHATDEYLAVAPARHTRSTVPAGAASTGPDRVGAETPREHEAAADAFGYLPSPVRSRIVTAVPNPVVWLGELARYTTAGVVAVEETLSLCRVGQDAAVVLLASRAGHPSGVSAGDWTVNRHTFALQPHLPALGRTGPGGTHRLGR